MDQEKEKIMEGSADEWAALRELCGEVVRPKAHDGDDPRTQVVARSYTVNTAADRLGVRKGTLEAAIDELDMPAFIDPEDRLRVPAQTIEAILSDEAQREQVADFEVVRTREIATVCDLKFGEIRRRLRDANISTNKATWGEIRGLWDLPETYNEFRALLKDKQREKKQAQRQDQQTKKQRVRENRRKERERLEALRDQLLASFPTWEHDERQHQQMTLHVGPPNSGKTYESLEALKEAGSGWYLAPLRLLAFEVFDRLNMDGVLCNLLTGEERIDVPGAEITAATIEMFNPGSSGDMVVIDEAQMLADPDRGWAWTRAIMDATAPDIHIIGPLTARTLIEQMADAASMKIEVVEHNRLTPIKVADRHYPLDRLPDHTILVAFSRRTVLHLKTVLERMGRKVSVVYGNLPPEVRRKQADRFAYGETEICIATDAVGMGLNLPADYVVFYEVEKFDGRSIRLLTPSEVQQIGGRAGRYRLSDIGRVSATTKRNLRTIRELFFEEPEVLTHARVAPTVEDLALIPGHLADQLLQWAELESIPAKLRNTIRVADLTERVELARMLSDKEVRQLGLERAVRLINAPTRRSSRDYWRACADAILGDYTMPLPPDAPNTIENDKDLEYAEMCISCADIYLWLANRHEFERVGPDEPHVRQLRRWWSTRIDDALLKRLDTMRRCPECGEALPVSHPYRICEDCFQKRRFRR